MSGDPSWTTDRSLYYNLKWIVRPNKLNKWQKVIYVCFIVSVVSILISILSWRLTPRWGLGSIMSAFLLFLIVFLAGLPISIDRDADLNGEGGGWLLRKWTYEIAGWFGCLATPIGLLSLSFTDSTWSLLFASVSPVTGALYLSQASYTNRDDLSVSSEATTTDSNTQTQSQTGSDTNESTPGSATEDATTDYDQLQQEATEAIERAERAADWGDFDMAVDSCEEAITKIEQAIAGIDSDSNQELKTMLTDAQTTLETVTERREQQTEIVEALEPAERSFQEAIVAYIENNQTVARIRFRQARDAFEEVHETIAESENDLLGSSTEVSVQPDRELSSTTLSELVEIPEPAVDALSDAGIETLSDFESCDEWPWTPATVEKLVADGAIEENLATTLTLLSLLRDHEGCEFNAAEAVARRQEQADYGFNHAS